MVTMIDGGGLAPPGQQMHVAYVSLGSNLGSYTGDAAATVEAGVHSLAGLPGSREQAAILTSSLYRTTPVGFSSQPDFVNAVACLLTPLDPQALLAGLLAIENSFGRTRTQVNGPRTLDLDLLLYDDLVLSSATLVLPHPRMSHRRFVLEPLAEIAPELLHPTLKRTIAELLEGLPDEGEQATRGVRLLARRA